MTEFLAKLVSDHGLAAVLGIASIAVQLWMAKQLFAVLRGQNQSQLRIERDLARLLERNGIDSEPPPIAQPRRRGHRLLPRAPTPLPFTPVPQPIDDEEPR